MHKASSRFWRLFNELGESVQSLAHKNFELLKNDPQHPSLNFKKVGKYLSVRVGLQYRALAVEQGGDLIWIWIGMHDEYDRLIS